MKQTNHERPTVRPARLGFKMSEDPFGIVATVLGKGKNGDDDGEDTSKSPENGSGLRDDELATEMMRAGDDWLWGLTSSHGSHLLPREETKLQRMVMPRKMRKIW